MYTIKNIFFYIKISYLKDYEIICISDKIVYNKDI